MASVNLSSSSVRISAPPEKHEVFISFRGEDTRKTFTSHLNAAFKRHGIKTYIDDVNLERGNEISTTLLRAIKDAQLSVIVFSKNFAGSRWCLDELVKILELAKESDHIIVPVFYDVDLSTVRMQKASYADAFEKHEQKFKDDMEKVQLWRKSLTEASNYSGWDCTINRAEHEMVELIAKDVLEKLGRAYVGDLDLQIEKLEQMAELHEEFSEEVSSEINESNYEATLKRIKRLKMEKRFRMLNLTPDLLSHLQISPTTNAYF